jgi:hypothetical protein
MNLRVHAVAFQNASTVRIRFNLIWMHASNRWIEVGCSIASLEWSAGLMHIDVKLCKLVSGFMCAFQPTRIYWLKLCNLGVNWFFHGCVVRNSVQRVNLCRKSFCGTMRLWKLCMARWALVLICIVNTLKDTHAIDLSSVINPGANRNISSMRMEVKTNE